MILTQNVNPQLKAAGIRSLVYIHNKHKQLMQRMRVTLYQINIKA